VLTLEGLPETFPETEQQLHEEIEQGRVHRLFDSVFKFVFCKEEISPIFLDLANALVFPNNNGAFKKARLVDREKSPLRIKGKGFRLDVLAVMDDGGQINLEIQTGYKPGFLKRSLIYWGLVHSEQLSSGDPYKKIARTISVNLLGYDQFPNKPDFWNSFSVRDDKSGEKLNDDLLMIFLEIPKYERNCIGSQSKMYDWMAYFAGKGGREMEQIAEREPMISEALDREKLFLMDKEQRLAYILDWKHMMDEANMDANLREAEEKRKEAEGKRREAEGKLAFAAKNFLADGISPDKVAKNLGLSLEEVQNLTKE
jgi:predicted transposase/invertase (TIGR01784 family)